MAQLQDLIETTEPELFSWQPSSEQSVPGAVQESPSVDKMTSEVIRSGFDEKLIGEYLLRLAEGDRGIELAVAFASIIAKARKARFVRQRG